MNNYLIQTKFATEKLLDVIEHERKQLKELHNKQTDIESAHVKLLKVSQTVITCLAVVGASIAVGIFFYKLWPWLTSRQQPLGLIDVLRVPGPPHNIVQSAVRNWFLGLLITQGILLATRWLVKSRRAKLEEKYNFLSEEISCLLEMQNARVESYNCLNSALLQIAKQGIPSEHTGLQSCPDGRKIGSETLKNVIWQGRNQSLHYEESPEKRSQQVINCFANLMAEQGLQLCLDNPPRTNRAMFVVELLGWQTYTDYLQDMRLLLP